MESRKLIFAALLGAALMLPQPLRAVDSLSVRRVPSDVLVDYLRRELGQTVYFLKDSEDVASYTIETTRDKFVRESLDILKAKGYAVTEYDGAYFISAGKSIAVAKLPSDYFTATAKKKVEEKAESDESLTATFRNKVYEIGNKSVSGKTKAYVRGYVRDVQSGEALVGVSVYDEKTGAYSVTDVNGYYRVGLPVGENVLCFSGYSMEDLKLNLILYDDGGLDVQMKEKVTSLKGAVVS